MSMMRASSNSTKILQYVYTSVILVGCGEKIMYLILIIVNMILILEMTRMDRKFPVLMIELEKLIVSHRHVKLEKQSKQKFDLGMLESQFRYYC